MCICQTPSPSTCKACTLANSRLPAFLGFPDGKHPAVQCNKSANQRRRQSIDGEYSHPLPTRTRVTPSGNPKRERGIRVPRRAEMQKKGRKRPKPTKWQIYKRLKRISKHVSGTIKWDLLPVEVGIRILAFLQVRDLVRFSSVCKNWRDTILFSQYFKELHSRLCPPQKCILCFPECEIGVEPYFSIEYFYVSKTGTTLLSLQHPGLVFANDGGFVCMSRMQEENLTYEVGNPLINSWKTIPNPSEDFVPTDMIVDKSSGAYMILAKGSKSNYAEVYDSRQNLWRKGGTVDCSGVPHNELIGTSDVFFRYDGEEEKVAIYDFAQDRSSWVNFDYPNFDYEVGKYACDVFKCKDRMILVGLAQRKPKIELWSGSILNGTLKWTLMTELRGAAVKELIYKAEAIERENKYYWLLHYFPEKWYPKVALGEHHSILIAIAGAEKDTEHETFLLEYDLAKCLWKPIRIPVTLHYFPDNSSPELRLMFFYPTLFLP